MSTPREDGLRMPAEWAPHERTLIAWPQREDAWRGTSIEAARRATAEVAAAVAEFEPVLLVTHPKEEERARRMVTRNNLDVVAIPIDDSWLRDSGPIVVRDPDGPRRAGVDFRFNAWGEAFEPYDHDAEVAERLISELGLPRYESEMVLEGGSIAVDGAGALVTTEQCLLNPNRNPNLKRADIEQRLEEYLGATHVVWLGQGLVEDVDTDGHVDNICAFVAPGRVLLQVSPDDRDPNREACEENLERARAEGLEVEEWDLLPRIERDGEAVAVPYLNFYIANDALIVPVAGLDPDMDQEALARLGALYPGREPVAVDGQVLALGGGGVHCITQQVPAA